MTCIIGYIEKDKVYIGADSAPEWNAKDVNKFIREITIKQ